MKPKTLQNALLAAACLFAVGPVTAQTHYTSYTNNTNLTLASGDTLTVSSGNVEISYGGSGTGLARTLDASLAASVTFDIDNLRVGTRSDPTSTATSDRLGTLNLGAINTITASTIVSIGGGGHIVSGILTTPNNSTTVISTPVMDIGTAMRTSTPAPNLTTGSGSTFTLQGISGGRTALTIGEERQGSASINWSSTGNMDLSGGQASLKLSSLVVGNSTITAAQEVGFSNGTLTMGSNTSNQLDISGTGSVMRIGMSAKNDNDSRNSTTGTVTIGHLGSNSTITSTNNGDAILIANNTGSASRPVTGTLNLNGGTVTITTSGAAITGGTGGGTNSTLNLSGGVTLRAGASSTNWITGLTTAAINSGGAVIDSNGYNLGVSQAFSGTGGLTKAGEGTLALGGIQAFAGATEVTAGTLAISGSGSINSSSGVTVSSGAKLVYNSSTALTAALTLSGNGTGSRAVLGGTGPISQALTLNNVGDVLSPGNSPGIQAYTVSQSWDSFSYDWEVNDFTGTTAGTAFDQITITGSLALTGGSGSYILNVLSLTSSDVAGDAPNFSEIDRSWSILTTTGGITGFDASAWQINTAGFTNNEAGLWSIASNGNNLVLSYTAIPEPRAALLGGLGMLMLLRRRR